MPWVTGIGVAVNPVAGTVLADTGPLHAGAYDSFPFVWCSTITTVIFEHRDAANAVTLDAQVFSQEHPMPMMQWVQLDEGERLRVITRENVKGQIDASIFYQARPLQNL